MTQYSIIIPVYNVETYLPACLDSILTQTSTSLWEAILVDDGSPDGSGAICDAYAARDARFRVIHQKNGGVGAARNAGLRAARGEYVLYFDADDFWEPNLLSETDGLLEKRPDAAVFAYHRVWETGEKQAVRLPLVPEGESGMAWLERLFSVPAVPFTVAWCYVFRREFLLRNGLFYREDLKVSEDFEYNMRVVPLAKSIVGTDLPLYGYRVRESSVTNAPLSVKKLLDNLTCKAEAFRRYPVAAMANLYAGNMLLVGHLSKQDAAQLRAVLRQNRDILRHVKHPKLRVGCVLTALLGDYAGARMFRALQALSGQLRGRG